MAYTVLARRYRSETFDDLVGQEAIAQTLKNAIVSDRVAHAYLFTGTRGVGKTSMARILAKALNCLAFDAPTATPCCKCESCQAISVGTDIDVIEIDGASNNSVDNIREMRQSAIYSAARSRFKIYIIDEVHMLSASAFNALLKTLEEPPPHVKFIFATTEANKILPTILSRCQRFDFRNIPADDIVRHLMQVLEREGVKSDDAVVRRVARLANGSMRDGLSLLDQLLSMAGGELQMAMLNELLGTPGNEQVIKLADAMAGGDLAAVLMEFDRIVTGGFVLEQVVDGLQMHFRDLMILRQCGSDTELVDISEPEQRQCAIEQSKLFDDATLVYHITIMEELKRHLKASGAGRPLVEAALVRLTVSERFSDAKNLIELLCALPVGGMSPGKTIEAGSSTISSRPNYNASTGTPGWKTTSSPKKTDERAKESPQTEPQKMSPEISLEYGLEEMRRQWPALIEKTGMFKQFLMKAIVKSWDGSELVISYGTEDLALGKALVLMPDHVNRMEKGFSELFNKNIKVHIEMPDADNGNSMATVRASNQAAAPGARPSRQDNEKAISNKKVQQVIEALNGKIASIERINE